MSIEIKSSFTRIFIFVEVKVVIERKLFQLFIFLLCVYQQCTYYIVCEYLQFAYIQILFTYGLVDKIVKEA